MKISKLKTCKWCGAEYYTFSHNSIFCSKKCLNKFYYAPKRKIYPEIIDLEGEVWRDVINYEELYEVSNLGRVRSKDRVICKKYHKANHEHKTVLQGVLLKGLINHTGYMSVILSKSNKLKSCRNHRLVAESFLPNPENKPQVNHIDGNKLNNRVENLEWATCSENISHAFKLGLNTPRRAMLGRSGKNCPTSKRVKCISKYNDVKFYDSLTEAAISENTTVPAISNNLKGISKTCKNKIFYYA